MERNTRAHNQYLSVIIGGILPFVYGNSIAWSSTALPQLEGGGEDMPTGKDGIDSFTSGWVGGAYCIGALVFSPLFGLLADYIGRKRAAYFVGLSFVVHWAMIAFGNNITWILVGRAFGGIGGTGSITVNAIFNNEVSEEKHRGTLGSFLALFYACGLFFAYVMGAFFTFHTVAYTYLSISIMFFVLWWNIPESPVYLVLKEREKLAIKSISWLRSCSEKDAIEFVQEIKIQQAGAAKPATVLEFFRNKAARRGIFIAFMLMAIQTFSGIFAIHTYASSIFKRASGAIDPLVSTMIYGFMMCVGALLPPLLVDRLGRKFLLMWSSFFLSLCMITMGFYFLAMKYGYIGEDDSILSLVPLIALSACVVIYYMGLGSVTYISAAEIFTDENRGVAGSLVAISIWSTSFVLLLLFSPAVEMFGDYTVFFIFAAVCFFGAIYIRIYLPETKGRNSADIAAELIAK